MNDFPKVASLISGILLAGIFSFTDNLVYGESDFTLELKTNPVSITKLEFSDESYKRLCPSGQCKVNYEGKYTNFIPPSAESMSLAYHIDFVLQDNVTNADLGTKIKNSLENLISYNKF